MQNGEILATIWSLLKLDESHVKIIRMMTTTMTTTTTTTTMMYMSVLPECIYGHQVHDMPTEIRRECQLLWNWSYRQFLPAMAVMEMEC